jgi:di/tripeptidase
MHRGMIMDFLPKKDSQVSEDNKVETCASIECERVCLRQKTDATRFYKYCPECTSAQQGFFTFMKSVKTVEHARGSMDAMTMFDSDKLLELVDDLERYTQEIRALSDAKVGEKRKRE